MNREKNFLRNNYGVYVLGLPGKFRNQRDIDHSLIRQKITQVNGLDKNSEAIDELDLESPTFFFWHNRAISRAEAACALGHRLIIETAYQDCVDFAVVVEDDGLIPTMEDIENFGSFLNSKRPILLVLAFKPKDIVFSKISFIFQRKNFRKCLSTPQLTQSYALNRSAIAAIAERQALHDLDSLADFPPWYFDILDFYTISEPQPVASELNSLIGLSGRTAQASDLRRRIYRFALLGWFCEGYRYCSLSSYVRYVHGRALASLKPKSEFLARIL
jgi:hypothetical protein